MERGARIQPWRPKPRRGSRGNRPTAQSSSEDGSWYRAEPNGMAVDELRSDHRVAALDAVAEEWHRHAVESPPNSFALGPGEGRFIDLGAFGMTVKARAEETGGQVAVLEADEPPGFGPPIHVHHDCAEAFYVLAGEYIMYLDDREVVCPAGSFIFIPQGARHGFRVGDTPSRKLNFYFPASMIGYFDSLAAALQRDGVSDRELDEIATAHAMEIVAPPPSDRYV